MSYILAIGPSAPSWPGPQRLVLTIEQETVADVTYYTEDDEYDFVNRLSYMDRDQVLQRVTRISKTSAWSHALAFCQALETLADVAIPERAAYLRCAGAEFERLQAHLIALQATFSLLDLRWQTTMLQNLLARTDEAMIVFHHSDNDEESLCLPGGVRHDLTEMQHVQLLSTFSEIKEKLFLLIDHTIDERRLLARTVDIGVLEKTVTAQFGLSGPVARAAGLEVDVRMEQPYAAYDKLAVRRIVREEGDVHARLVVLLLEAFESLKLAEQALQELPPGALQADFPQELPPGAASAMVEAPRGNLQYMLQSDGYRLTSLNITPPRQIDRLLARTLFVGTLVDNVVLVALSIEPRTDYSMKNERQATL